MLLALVALGLLHLWANHTGRAEWNSMLETLRERGEPLTLDEVQPQPLPDAENFAAAEVIVSLRRDPDRGRAPSKLPDFGGAGKQHYSKLRRAALAVDSEFKGSDVEAAEIVLEQFSGRQAFLNELRAAAARPGAWWDVDYRDEMHELINRQNGLIRIAVSLSRKMLAHLELGQSAAALQEGLLMLDLAQHCQAGGLLISFMISQAIVRITCEIVLDGIADGAWTEDDLETLRLRLAEFDPVGDYLEAQRLERAVNIEVLGDVSYAGYYRKMRPKVDNFSLRERLWIAGFHLLPQGWFQSDLTQYYLWVQELLDAGSPLSPETPDRIVDLENAATRAHDSRWFALGAASALASPIQLAAHIRCMIDLTMLACAIETQRLRHGSYPATLAAVEEIFPEGMPLDPLTGEPYLYRRGADGALLLYGHGWNQRDNGGDFGNRPFSRDAPDWGIKLTPLSL